MRSLVAAAFVAFVTALMLLAWLSHDAPAEPWVCQDVPCESSEQCPPSCSACWAGRCQP